MQSLELHNETIDRKSAVTLHAKQAFLDWVASIAPHHPLVPSKWSVQQLIASRESIAWIIPSVGQFDSEADLQSYLNSFKPAMLVSAVRAVISNEKLWPELSVETFDAFFELHVHPHVASIKHLSPDSTSS